MPLSEPPSARSQGSAARASSPSGSGSGSGPRSTPRRGVGARVWRALKIALLTGLAIALLAAFGAFLVVQHFEADLPSISDLKGNYNPPQVTRVLARDGTLLSEIFTERRTVVSIATLPPHVKLAVLAAEDAAFYEHEGLNYFGMLRGVHRESPRWAHAAGRKHHHATGREESAARPESERAAQDSRGHPRAAARAANLERRDPRALPESHLFRARSVRYRRGCPLLLRQAGARGDALGRRRCSPGWSPVPSSIRRVTTRRSRKIVARSCLAQMLDKGFIDQRQHDAAMTEPLRLAAAVEPQGQLAPEVIELVKRTLKEAVGEDQAAAATPSRPPSIPSCKPRPARRCATTSTPTTSATSSSVLSRRRQRQRGQKEAQATEHALRGRHPGSPITRCCWAKSSEPTTPPGIIDIRVGTVSGSLKLRRLRALQPAAPGAEPIRSRGDASAGQLVGAGRPVSRGDAKVPLRLELGPEGAMVALDVRTREVLALVGSYEAASGALDRVTQAHRQPGSSFKPFVYSYGALLAPLHAGDHARHQPGTL